jgi:hypothetical protein
LPKSACLTTTKLLCTTDLPVSQGATITSTLKTKQAIMQARERVIIMAFSSPYTKPYPYLLYQVGDGALLNTAS